MGDVVSINVKGLEQLVRALKTKPPRVRVGILGDGGARDSAGGMTGTTNAEIGAAHEFGNSVVPQRSFLRVPLANLLAKRMAESGAFDKMAMAAVVRSGTLVPWCQKIATIAEDIVVGAFDTQGYGEWPPWKDPNYENNTGQVLLDTQQLRNSISSEVSE